MRVAKHLRILGRVQAVGFRFFMEREARVRGITGWVRNRRDGSVEAVVQGSPEAVEEMIACARRGPRSAHVTEVRVAEHDGDYTEFTIRPTE